MNVICRGELCSPARFTVCPNGRTQFAPTDYEENFLFSIIKFCCRIGVHINAGKFINPAKIKSGINFLSFYQDFDFFLSLPLDKLKIMLYYNIIKLILLNNDVR